MTRTWTRWAGIPIDAVGLVWCVLILLAAALLVGAAWHTYPAWVPRASWLTTMRGLRPRWPKWRWRRKPAKKGTEAKPGAAGAEARVEDDQLPDLPSDTLMSHADALAAEGRYAEAVRERLRAIVRELVDTGVITHHPAWTVTELSRAAARVRPPMGPALDGASRVFSDIWYGQRPAHVDHDQQMRRHAADVHALVTAPLPHPADPTVAVHAAVSR